MKRKFFVNVPGELLVLLRPMDSESWPFPVIMGWVFSAMKLILSRETVKKFTILNSGSQVAGELGHADKLPKEYGGTASIGLGDIAVKERKAENMAAPPTTDPVAEAV